MKSNMTPKSFLSILRSFRSCLPKCILSLPPTPSLEIPFFYLKMALSEQLSATDKQAICLISAQALQVLKLCRDTHQMTKPYKV